MLLGARASDIFGLRRVLAIGITVFVLGSLAVAWPRTPPCFSLPVRRRALAGAVLAPAGISLIIAARADGPSRSRALTVYQSVSAVAVTIAVVIGGLLTQELSWRAVMFVNVPVGIGLLIAVLRLLNPAYKGRPGERLDILGAVVVTLGIGALIEGFASAQQFGWGSPLTIAFLAGGLLMLVVFVIIERRVAQPLVRLNIFFLPGIAPGTLILALNGTVLTASTLFVSLILQSDLGDDALASGLALVPYVLASVFAGFGGDDSDEVGAGALHHCDRADHRGCRICLVGDCSAPTHLCREHSRASDRRGIGLGAAVVPTTRAATAAVTAQDARARLWTVQPLTPTRIRNRHRSPRHPRGVRSPTRPSRTEPQPPQQHCTVTRSPSSSAAASAHYQPWSHSCYPTVPRQPRKAQTEN